MISYELAKQLKEAGFQQTGHKKPCHHGNQGYSVLVEGCKLDKCGVCYPTLSELIEACGDSFFILKKNVFWQAATPGNCNPEYIETLGLTPEEAVAKLYLELNKK